jgi:hypothetical protein
MRQLLVRGVVFTFDLAKLPDWRHTTYESRDFVGLWAIQDSTGAWALYFREATRGTGAVISWWRATFNDLAGDDYLDSLALFVRSARQGELEVVS